MSAVSEIESNLLLRHLPRPSGAVREEFIGTVRLGVTLDSFVVSWNIVKPVVPCRLSFLCCSTTYLPVFAPTGWVWIQPPEGSLEIPINYFIEFMRWHAYMPVRVQVSGWKKTEKEYLQPWTVISAHFWPSSWELKPRYYVRWKPHPVWHPEERKCRPCKFEELKGEL